MSSLDFGVLTQSDPVPIKDRCVVRLSTSIWSTNRGIHISRSLQYLRRKCVGYNILEEDIAATSASEVLTKIVNLDRCADGIYVVVCTNQLADWETGYIDSYDYELIKWVEPTTEETL